MAKFSEETFDNWRKPPSDTEEAKLTNAQRQIKEAISKDTHLNKLSLEIFAQGSYANDTNVRLNSDVDINAMYNEEFFFDLPPNTSNKDYGFDLSDKLPFPEYKNLIESALVNYFGIENVKRDNKCIRILGNSTRVASDVVPTYNHRRYSTNKSYVEGVQFFSDSNDKVIGFPKQHLQNAVKKNSLTAKKFKRVTRIHKRLRYRMKDEIIKFPDSMTSFLIECLAWNLPNDIYNRSNKWTDIIRESIVYIYNKTKSPDDCKEWGEVSELLYLFHNGRKWSVENVNEYMQILWNYLEF